MLFALQCKSVQRLQAGRAGRVSTSSPGAASDQYGLEAQLQGQGTRLGYMPPFAGNLADRQALADHLERMGAQRRSFLPRGTMSKHASSSSTSMERPGGLPPRWLFPIWLGWVLFHVPIEERPKTARRCCAKNPALCWTICPPRVC